MVTKNALFTFSLRLADDALILGHRLSEWCSRAPFLEEDLALTNISLDLIGRAQAFLSYAAELEGKGKTEDDLAYRRSENNYFNHLITELPNGDFAHTITRQLFITLFEYHFFSELEQSNDKTIAAIAAKTCKEVKYHLEHASDWVVRLGEGTKESHTRMQIAINDLWMYTGELFEMDEVDYLLIREGIAADKVALKTKWMSELEHLFSEVNLEIPADTFMQTGSRKGIHTENMGHILSEMQYLQRAYPDAKW